MLKLNNKSLIIIYFNVELNKYIYGIHDVLLKYLKLNYEKSELINLHKTLINKYLQNHNNNKKILQYYELPNDNYIYTYIGYHLYESELFNEFNEIYFNLLFIQSKIHNTNGSFDILCDYKKYYDYIIKNTDINKYDEYLLFIKTYGQFIFKYKYVSIIQYILNLTYKTEFLYMDAIKLIQSDFNLYFIIKQTNLNSKLINNNNNNMIENNQLKYKSSISMNMNDKISVVCYTHDINIILIGFQNGQISVSVYTVYPVYTGGDVFYVGMQTLNNFYQFCYLDMFLKIQFSIIGDNSMSNWPY